MNPFNRLWNTSLVELAVSEGSVRLKNALLQAQGQGMLPANSIYEFVSLGENPEKLFLKIPNFGAKSAQELVDIIGRYRRFHNLSEVPNNADFGASSCYPISIQREQLDLDITETITLSEIVEQFSDNNRLRNIFEANARLEPIYGLTLNEWETLSEGRRKAMLLPLGGFGALTYKALISAVEAFKSAKCDFPKGESTELLDEPSIAETLPQSNFHEPIFEYAFEFLDERSTKILKMRYESGLTLEEVGKSFGVTRERIRQIEKKGLELFSRKYLSIADSTVLPWLFDKIWERIAGENCFLRKSTFHEKSSDLPFSYRLSGVAVYGSIRKMVSNFCVDYKEVWVFGYDDEAISIAFDTVSEFLKQSPIPLLLPWLSSEVNVESSLVEAAIETNKRYVLHRNILLDSPLTLRKRRLVSLWYLLAHKYSSGPVRLMDFHDTYLSENEGDQCSARDLLIVMKDQPKLFQRAGSFGWLLLNPAVPLWDQSCVQPAEQIDEIEGPGEQEISFEYQDPSLRGLLIEILKDGPRPYKEIFESVRKSSGAGYSKGSVAAIISTYPEFDFFAPGLIGLFRSRNDSRHIEVGKSYLFQTNPVRQYILAQIAGRPIVEYPCWNYEYQRELQQYLLANNYRAELGSLLEFELDDNGQRQNTNDPRLSELAKSIWERMELPEWSGLSLYSITPQHIIRCAWIALKFGCFNWMSANRIAGDRLDSLRRGPTLVALMTGVGILKPKRSWYLSHEVTPTASSLLLDLLDIQNTYSGDEKFWEFFYKRLTETYSAGWFSSVIRYELEDSISEELKKARNWAVQELYASCTNSQRTLLDEIEVEDIDDFLSE